MRKFQDIKADFPHWRFLENGMSLAELAFKKNFNDAFFAQATDIFRHFVLGYPFKKSGMGISRDAMNSLKSAGKGATKTWDGENTLEKSIE